jgi:hypothetical protein
VWQKIDLERLISVVSWSTKGRDGRTDIDMIRSGLTNSNRAHCLIERSYRHRLRHLLHQTLVASDLGFDKENEDEMTEIGFEMTDFDEKISVMDQNDFYSKQPKGCSSFADLNQARLGSGESNLRCEE